MRRSFDETDFEPETQSKEMKVSKNMIQCLQSVAAINPTVQMTQDNPLVVEALSGSVAVEYQPPVSFGNACIGDLQQLTRCMSFMESPELEFFEDELILRDSLSAENPTLSIKHVLPEGQKPGFPKPVNSIAGFILPARTLERFTQIASATRLKHLSIENCDKKTLMVLTNEELTVSNQYTETLNAECEQNFRAVLEIETFCNAVSGVDYKADLDADEKTLFTQGVFEEGGSISYAFHLLVGSRLD